VDEVPQKKEMVIGKKKRKRRDTYEKKDMYPSRITLKSAPPIKCKDTNQCSSNETVK
jgi:hypothetical protein